jgi:hypothetical protein
MVRFHVKPDLIRSSVTQAPGFEPDFQAEAASLVQDSVRGLMLLKSPETGAM